MKTLLLIRHTKSDWSKIGQSDFDRPLKKSREKDAKKVAEVIAEKKIPFQKIISSPAKRALDTAKLFCKKWGRDKLEIELDARLYEYTHQEVLSIVHQIDNRITAAVIFGHNPAFTEFTNLFTKKIIENVPTTGAICFEFDTDEWKKIKRNNASLKFFVFPKMYT